MTAKGPRNMAASVKQRLLNLARERGEEFNLLLTRYALERLLFRLGESTHRRSFVVKGALMFSVWSMDLHRATHDLDLLGFGPAEADRMEGLFRELCDLDSEDDGVVFDRATVRATPIREDLDYSGIRVRLVGRLGTARLGLQVDVGFGDAVSPRPEWTNLPALLDQPPPRLRVYPREAMVAEKFQTIVDRGMANSRMKDYFDLYILSREFDFEGQVLVDAIRATFQRRQTPIPGETPVGLSDRFSVDETKTIQWNAFCRKSRLQSEAPLLPEVVDTLGRFLMPVTKALGGEGSLDLSWTAGGPWQPAGAEGGE